MTSISLNADHVFVIHLRSYGFFHSGRERLVVQVLKRTWDHIPGSTLYGALASALLHLDPPMDYDKSGDKEALRTLDQKTVNGGQGQYFDLLRAVEKQQIRFTPLLPSVEPLKCGETYCKQAMRLIRRNFFKRKEPSSAKVARKLFHTTPHAPLARGTEQIHGDQLFALQNHRSQLDYYGFIFAKVEHRPWLEKALSFFPFMPVGGRGKFSLVEGQILDDKPLTEFRDELANWTAECDGWIHLLTPLIRPGKGIAEPLDINQVEEVVMTGFQRYRVWRTGLYFNGQSFDDPVGADHYYGNDNSPLQTGGAESVAVQAVPERSRFRLKDKARANATRWFIEGVGHPGWSYLGWGQVVIE